jgi:hypothetical protein
LVRKYLFWGWSGSGLKSQIAADDANEFISFLSSFSVAVPYRSVNEAFLSSLTASE